MLTFQRQDMSALTVFL